MLLGAEVEFPLPDVELDVLLDYEELPDPEELVELLLEPLGVVEVLEFVLFEIEVEFPDPGEDG